MRTTLKRGVGRGGDVGANGNGHAVFPPAALTPITLYRQPPPQRPGRARLALRYGGWFLGVLLMVVLGVGGGLYLWAHESVNAVQAHSRDAREAQKRLDAIPLPGQAAIALVVGYDKRAGSDAELTATSRSDTVMLLRADPRTKSISLLSFPRDMIVDIRCPGMAPETGPINYAYSKCGTKGTLETVRNLTGLPINYLITVNFHGFKQIVNRIGGVWIDVDRRYFNNVGGPTGYAKINLQPGYQLLTGGAALDYVRFRHTDSDLYRVARQQQFVKAVKYQLKHSFGLTQALGIVGALTHNVEVGVGGGKELDLGLVQRYIRLIYDLPGGHFIQVKIEGLTGYNALHTDPANIQKAVQDFANPDIAAPAAANDSALGVKPKKAVAPQPSETTLTVLNGNGVAGSASNASYLLGQRGYRIVLPANGIPANAPRFDYFRTMVYFDHLQPGAKLAAESVATLFGGADTAWLPQDIAPLSSGALVTVVVGQTFHNTLGSVPVEHPVTKQAPSVYTDASVGRSLAEKVRGKVSFPVLVPTVLERSSRPDYELPVRAYNVTKGKWGVVMVFKTGGGEFWHVEQTDWTDAPILNDRSFHRRLGGRKYDLYYNGSHLHMVVLRTNGASYWVVNTLLDTLSNETMLAIAEGLRPIAR